MINGAALKEGEYYSTGSSILKIHKVHHAKTRIDQEYSVDVTIYSPNGTSVYSQHMPVRMLRELIPMGPHLAEVLFS